MKNFDALLVIDMQLVAFDGKITPPIQSGDRLLAIAKELIVACRAADLHVIYIQTRAVSGQPYAQDCHGWEIHPSIAPFPDDPVVFKVNSNGFEETDLQDVLKSLGVKSILTCGIWSEFCLRRTSLAALELGFDVHVAADAHGTVAESEQAAAKVVREQNEDLARKGVTVSSVQDFVKSLANNSGLASGL